MFSELLARFRALALTYQTAHWSAQGPLFYGDHLLFDRLYNEVNDAIDTIAEKGIGVTGVLTHVILPEHLTQVQTLVSGIPTDTEANVDYITYALTQEHALYEFLATANSAEQHIGVQNLIQDLADQGTQRLYLLRRRATDLEDQDQDDDSGSDDGESWSISPLFLSATVVES